MAILSPAQSETAAQAPADMAFAITPSDSTIFTTYTRAIYVGGDGNISVRMADMETGNVSFTNVKAGTVLPIRVRMVRATGTTATGLVGLY